MRNGHHHRQHGGHTHHYLVHASAGLAYPGHVAARIGIGGGRPIGGADDGEDEHRDAEVAVGYLIGGNHRRGEKLGNQYVRRHEEQYAGYLQHKEFHTDGEE